MYLAQLSGKVVLYSLEFLLEGRSSEPLKKILINNVPSAFFFFPVQAKQAEMTISVHVWDQVANVFFQGVTELGSIPEEVHVCVSWENGQEFK